MNKIRTLHNIYKYAFTSLASENAAEAASKKSKLNVKKEFGDFLPNILKKNQLENFVLGLETQEIKSKDLETITSFFRLWNQIVISKTNETKGAAIHEMMMLIANCDPKIKIETGVINIDSKIKASADYSFYQMSWPYPFVVFEESGAKEYTLKKCAQVTKAIAERYRFPRSYGLVTNLDLWIFTMYNITEPIDKLKTYTYSLNLSDEEKLQENIEDIMKKTYAFIKNALYEYRTLKNTVNLEPAEDSSKDS
jgi:hypothetical protein